MGQGSSISEDSCDPDYHLILLIVEFSTGGPLIRRSLPNYLSPARYEPPQETVVTQVARMWQKTASGSTVGFSPSFFSLFSSHRPSFCPSLRVSSKYFRSRYLYARYLCERCSDVLRRLSNRVVTSKRTLGEADDAPWFFLSLIARNADGHGNDCSDAVPLVGRAHAG